MSPTAYEPLERRPIKSRDTRWAQALAGFLVRVGASPNAISIFGMFAAIVAGAAFAATSQTGRPGPATARGFRPRRCARSGSFAICWMAWSPLPGGTASRTGELYNEVPDRISDAAVFIGLGYAAGGQAELGYLAALVSVFVAYVRAMARSLGARTIFAGPMAKPQRMALATVLGVYYDVCSGELVPDLGGHSTDYLCARSTAGPSTGDRRRNRHGHAPALAGCPLVAEPPAMSPWQRLFDPSQAFDHPVTVGIVVAIAVGAGRGVGAGARAGSLGKDQRYDLPRTSRPHALLVCAFDCHGVADSARGRLGLRIFSAFKPGLLSRVLPGNRIGPMRDRR